VCQALEDAGWRSSGAWAQPRALHTAWAHRWRARSTSAGLFTSMSQPSRLGPVVGRSHALEARAGGIGWVEMCTLPRQVAGRVRAGCAAPSGWIGAWLRSRDLVDIQRNPAKVGTRPTASSQRSGQRAGREQRFDP